MNRDSESKMDEQTRRRPHNRRTVYHATNDSNAAGRIMLPGGQLFDWNDDRATMVQEED